MYSSQPVFAESALQKSLLELRKAIQEQVQKSPIGDNQPTTVQALKQDGNIEDVFDAAPAKKKQEIELYWKTKAELFNAIAENKIPKLTFDTNLETKRRVVTSIATILTVDYKTPVLVNDISDEFCSLEFNNVPRVIGLITESKFMKLGDTPPNFLGSPDVEYNNSEGRRLLVNLKRACTMMNGSKAVYPFVNSLSSLLKEYSDLTEVHVEKMRLAKIEEFKVNQEKERLAKIEEDLISAQQKKEADEFAFVAKAEKDLADSKARAAAKQEADRALREKQFQDELNRKEAERERICLASAEYKRFTSATMVKENLSQVDYAKKSIQREKDIGKVSGYEDAGKLNELGRLQIFAQDLADSAFKEYKKYGGKAFLQSGVVVGKNPCL